MQLNFELRTLNPMKQSPFVIITGLSGSGKGTFLRALEDQGYFCVDNLPVELLEKFYELFLKSEGEIGRAALVIDAREQSLDELPVIFSEIKRQQELKTAMIFLEASDEVLVRRYSETRRPHPLDPDRPVIESIALERERLAPIRALADYILDTSRFTIHELRKYVTTTFEEQEPGQLLVSLTSFGFKYGIPVDSDLVFDVRFLPNPNFVPHLKKFTGAEPAVVEYMKSYEVTNTFLDHLRNLLGFLMPQFEREGKSYLTISIGCTGGRHRSVMIANEVAAFLKDTKSRVKVFHRDVEKG